MHQHFSECGTWENGLDGGQPGSKTLGTQWGALLLLVLNPQPSVLNPPSCAATIISIWLGKEECVSSCLGSGINVWSSFARVYCSICLSAFRYDDAAATAELSFWSSQRLKFTSTDVGIMAKEGGLYWLKSFLKSRRNSRYLWDLTIDNYKHQI